MKDAQDYFKGGLAVSEHLAFPITGGEISDLVSQMNGDGLRVDHIDTTGELQRVSVIATTGVRADRSGERSGYYVFFQTDQLMVCVYGNWRSNLNWKWSNKAVSNLSPSEQAELSRQVQIANERAKANRKERQEEVAKECAERFDIRGQELDKEHKYLVSKKVKNVGLKVNNRNELLIPIRSISGEIVSLQTISPTGTKKFASSSKVKGGIFLIGCDHNSLPNLSEIYVAEGYATAVSVAEATNKPVAVVFAAPFCLEACSEIRKVSQAKLILALDNDSNGVGEKCANETAKAVSNAILRIPPQKGDWNDAYLEHGIEYVRNELEQRTVIGIRQFAVRDLSSSPPEREWLIDGLIPMAVPGVLAAVGGIGKSMEMLKLSMACISGGQWMGKEVTQRGNVVFVNAEDDRNELWRRLTLIDPSNTRKDALHDLFCVTVPDLPQPLTLVKEDSGGLGFTPTALELLEEIKSHNPVLVVFDPLQAMISAPVNSNEVGQVWGQYCASMASKLACSVVSIHHMSKTALGKNDDPMMMRASIRGASSLVDSQRWAAVMYHGSEKEAKFVCQRYGVEYDPNRLVRFAMVKSNSQTDMRTKTLFRKDAILELLEETRNEFVTGNPWEDENE